MEGTEDARKVCGASGKRSGNAQSRAMAAGSLLPAHRSDASLVRQNETPRPRALSDHRKCRALSVAVENRGTNMHPTAAAFASLFVPSNIDARFEASADAKYLGNAQLSAVSSPKITHTIPRRP